MNETNPGQPEMTETTVVIVIASQVINFCLGLPLYSYVINLLWTKNGGGGVDVNVIFALNLTAAEIFYSLVAPLYCSCIVSLKLCIGSLLGFWLGASMPGRYLFQCTLCLEQYIAVIHPVIFLKLRPLRYRVGFSCGVWLCAVGIGICSACTFPLVPYNIFGVVYFTVFFLDSFCCLSVLKALVRPGPGDKDDGEMNAAKKKAFKIISMNLVTFLVQVFPIFIGFCLQTILPQQSFHLGVSISMSINIAGGFIHPIYCLYKFGKLPCSNDS